MFDLQIGEEQLLRLVSEESHINASKHLRMNLCSLLPSLRSSKFHANFCQEGQRTKILFLCLYGKATSIFSRVCFVVVYVPLSFSAPVTKGVGIIHQNRPHLNFLAEKSVLGHISTLLDG